MRFAICQELFEGWEWGRQCRFAAEVGYTGLEVAPFTLAGHPREVSAARRAELRRTAENEGVEIAGLHWLLAKTSGLHLTSGDASVRRQTAEYLRELCDLCGDLGGRVMVFGSPQQRNLAENVSREQAMCHAEEVFRQCLPTLEEREVTICLEPLTPKETNFINTCAEAAELITRVDHPRFKLHQDVKAMLSEAEPIPVLIDRYKNLTRHFHVNDSNLLGPGMGATEYAPIFRALRASGYDGWVSVEVFDYAPGAEHIARVSMEYMRATLSAVEVGSDEW
jgi:sugar phosphate isomerase/epimerase